MAGGKCLIKFKVAKFLSLRKMNKRIDAAEKSLNKIIRRAALAGKENIDIPVNYKGLNIKEFNMLLDRCVANGFYFTFTATSKKSPNFVTLSWSENKPNIRDLKASSYVSLSVTDKKVAIASYSSY